MKIRYSMPMICVCAALLVCLAASLASCNAQKRNTAAARKYTAFITKYNIMYNGETHFDETLKDMETKYEDDYSGLVLMHPIEAKNIEKAPQPSGDFTRSLEKAQKAIQIRSIKKKPAKKSGRGNDPAYKEWMKRDEYNPVMQDSWMLLGESQYYNGDFLGAASTFYYVSKHFTWLPRVVTEAQMWRALCYLSLDWLYEAEIIITRIKPEELTTSSLEGLYNFTYADFLVKSKEYEKAIPYLQKAISSASGAQKTRLRFLLGQIYAELGRKSEAYAMFKKAGSSPSAPYRTKLNARIKQSEVYEGRDITPEVKSLKSMVKYDRNKDYLDQIYYAIGNLYLADKDTTQAIANYELAAENSTRSGIDKAIAQITLGSLYFDLHNYEKAQPNYSEAISLLPKTYPNYALLKRRADVLDELAVYSQNVNLQDSLLRLSAMSEEQQMAVINKIIEDLKKKEKEEAEEAALAEYNAKTAANSNTLTDPKQRSFQINTDNSWYFYNSASKAAGKTEFQKRWGSRKLEDDWRRRNKTVFNTSDFDSDSDSADGEDEEGERPTEAPDSLDAAQKAEIEAANDPHNPEFYLKQIPKTEEEIATSNEIIQDGLYNMGVILKDKLEDYPSALASFDRLLADYPDNVYRLDVYYNIYLMYMREGNTAAAEKYRQLILQDFADSKYGQALVDPNYIENLRQMDSRQNQLYEQTYEHYLESRNDSVHQAYQTMMELYPLSPIMPKFMFLDALAYVTEDRPDEFNAVLRDMLDRYPQTDLAPITSAWLKGMAQGRQLHSSPDGQNMRGMLWDIHLTNDSTLFDNDGEIKFDLNEDVPQLLVLVYPADEISGNALLYEVARHNFNSFVVKDFDLEMMNFGRLGLLVIKGFENIKELNHYRSVMANSPDLRLPEEVTPVVISEQNFSTLLNQGRTFDDYFRYMQEQEYKRAQEGLIAPEDQETLSEAEAAADADDPEGAEAAADDDPERAEAAADDDPEGAEAGDDDDPEGADTGGDDAPASEPSGAPDGEAATVPEASASGFPTPETPAQ